jgi:PAS domain S-box-containing protein
MGEGVAGKSKEEKSQYERLLGGDLVGLFRTTVGGRLLDCNQTLVDLLGYGSIEELKGIPVKELYFNAAERQAFVETLAHRKKLLNYEILLKHRNGSSVHVLESVMIREEPGRPTVIEGVVIDITSVRQAEMEQRVLANNYRQLSERVRDGILIVQDGRVVFANPAAESLLAPANLLGATLSSLIDPKDRKMMDRQLSAGNKGATAEGAKIHFTTGGDTKRPLTVHAAATWFMNGSGVQLTLHDAEAEEDLMRERMRSKLAEEANAELRAEIAEHKRTQEALLKSRRLAKSLIDSSLDMIVGVDPKGMITEFNPAAAIKFGYEPEEVLGKNSRMLYADQEAYDKVQHEMSRFGAYAGEVRNINSEGKVFISFLAASRLFDEDGKTIGSMGVSRDVTQAKRDQEALRASEERFRDLVDNATDLIHSTDMDGNFLFVNNAWKRTLGYSDADLASIRLMDILSDGNVRESALNWLTTPEANPETQTWSAWFLTKDKRRILLEGTSNVRKENGVAIASRSIMRDITAAHAAQEQLLKHTEKEKALFQASEHMFWTVDHRIALTSFNQGYKDMIERLHGSTPVINMDKNTPRELFASKEYHDFWQAKYADVFKGNAARFETDLLDRNGERVCNEIYLSPVRDGKGRVVEVFGIGHEVTAERVAEAQVREQAAKLNAIFESSADVMIWSVDRNLNITACNKFFAQVGKQVFGKDMHVHGNIRESFRDISSPELDAEWSSLYVSCFAGKPQHRETHIQMENGAEMWLELFMSPIHTDGKVNGVSCLAHDITDKKRTEREMMESLREKEVLLKEVHHRVKNNLQIISSIFNLQRDHVEGDPQALELLLESRNRIHSMSFIHESLYQTKNFSQVDFAQYIEGLCRNLVLSYALNGKVRLHTELEHIMLDLDKAIPCGLILNELISNALKHAFPNNAEGVITIGLAESGHTVRITLGDNGCGFPKQYDHARDKGLGMELVEMLIEQLDGKVERSRTPGMTGTAYLITFERSRS